MKKSSHLLLLSVLLTVFIMVSVGFMVWRVSQTKAQSAVPPLVEFAMVGDSILAGRPVNIFQHTLVGIFSTIRPNWYIKNLSYSGASLSAPWTAVNPANQILANADVKKIVLMLGTNDWAANTPSSTFRTSYRNFLQVAGGYHPMVCVTPLWRSQEPAANSVGMTLENYREIIRSECSSKNYPIIEGKNLIPNSAQYFVDGIHPNVLGYEMMAQGFAPLLDAQLQ